MNQINDTHEHIRIDPRFNGPPGLGNGGIVCALIAEQCAADPHGHDAVGARSDLEERNGGEGLSTRTRAFEAELRGPAPLDRLLTVERHLDGEVALRDGDRLIACGRPRPLHIDVPEPPSWSDAEQAHAAGLTAPHPFPECFVCGPARREGDGLRAVAGPLQDRPGLVATTWRPHQSFAAPGTDCVEARFVWAALDCPGGIAALRGRCAPILLARYRGRLERRPMVGERCTLIGWPIADDGRKHVAGSALIDEDGRVLGCAEMLWIEPRAGHVHG